MKNDNEWLRPVTSYQSQFPAEAVFGLGSAAPVNVLSLRRLSRERQWLTNVAADTHLPSTEGEWTPHAIPRGTRATEHLKRAQPLGPGNVDAHQ